MAEIKKALKPEDSVTTNIIPQNTDKESFILYTEQKEVIDNLTDEDAGKLFKGIFEYAVGNEPEFNNLLKLVFIPIRQQLERNAKKYSEIKEKRRIAGAKGGKQKVANQANATFAKQNKQDQANQAVYVNGNVNVNVNDNVSPNGDINIGGETAENPPPAPASSGKKKFVPPTLDEVAAYCNERHNGISPSAFIDYYEARGWKYGTSKPMVNWKAAVRTWEQKEKGRTHTQGEQQKKATEEVNARIFEELFGGEPT